MFEIDYDKLGDDLLLSDSCGYTTASLRTKEAFSSFIGFYGVSPLALTLHSILNVIHRTNLNLLTF